MHVHSVVAVLALVLGAVGLAVPVAVPGPQDGDVSDQGAGKWHEICLLRDSAHPRGAGMQRPRRKWEESGPTDGVLAEVERVHSAAKVDITRIGDGY